MRLAPALPPGARVLRMALLTALGLLAIFVEAAPIGVGPQAIPSPDLLFCIVAAIALRQPASAPAGLVLALGLVRDLLTDLPVGLGALALLVASEALRARSAAMARRSLVSEWALVAAAFLAMLAVQWAVLFVTFVQPPYLFDLGRQWVVTMLAYAPVVLTIRWIFGIGWRAAAAPGRAGLKGEA
ncbi:hypothetical protein M1105_17500 [Limibaculum sp. FT325]|uniref:hypothetical protein n=1 Tax=Thermohalobaculum sediminis TaxID=2939436 RepID=UPI0020BF95E1|nr:hypothetical protein [Limibaculum sediminis]MCL5778775.1 hypothetical protein [Limibaculum sediminis]